MAARRPATRFGSRHGCSSKLKRTLPKRGSIPPKKALHSDPHCYALLYPTTQKKNPEKAFQVDIISGFLFAFLAKMSDF
jgi:hypothetical protein